MRGNPSEHCDREGTAPHVLSATLRYLCTSVALTNPNSSLVPHYTCENFNMALRGFAALSFAVLLAVFELGSCLRCYQCNSISDKDCADPFSANKPLVECNTQDSINYNKGYLLNILPPSFSDGSIGASRYCHKIVLGSGTVVRTCLDANPADMSHTCSLLKKAADIMPTDNSRRVKECSVCDKEGCNGAGAITASLPLAALAIIASYLYSKQ